ncbi:MAG: Gfo/Idh/MocA family oxidoreductase [Puniceicoccales bacterium]|jgi:predicted dehydrogenase|nr:Gfo/Idh/MocA family oxidoreductase [Puniceicoccales bacterium]
MKKPSSSRRDFLKTSALAGGLLLLPSGFLRGQNAPSNRLNYAAIGVGGMGGADTGGISGQKGVQLVGLCDVDKERLDGALRKYTPRFPKVRGFRDYRELLEKLGKDIDAVSVSTPDHTHFTAAYSAVELGKHVYVQKPLCHTISQVRRLSAKAAANKVVTQMGNQGSSSAHTRLAREWFEAGLLGNVKEVAAWSDRPIWPQGMKDYRPVKPVPEKLGDDGWDLWLGPAKFLDYRDGLHAFAWRGYYAFGCGALGDMAIHLMYDAYYALGLTAPTKIEVSNITGASDIAYPLTSNITFHFPATERSKNPVKFTWYDGRGSNNRPQSPNGQGLPGNGSVLYGDKIALSVSGWGNEFKPLLKEGEERPKNPPKKYERVRGGHYANWVNGILKGEELSSSFDKSGPFAEVILLGVIASRLKRTLTWDAKSGTFTGDDEANALVKGGVPRAGFKA